MSAVCFCADVMKKSFCHYKNKDKNVEFQPLRPHLTCVMKDNKPDTQGNFTFEVDGNCFNGNFGAATNMLTVQYRYKEGNGSYSSWQNMSVSRSGNTY